MGKIYVFTRHVLDQGLGGKFDQEVDIFASSSSEAVDVLRKFLKDIADGQKHSGPAYRFGSTDDWRIDEVPLDEPRWVTALLSAAP